MKYTLITANGSIQQFYVKSVADLYCKLYGGVVFTQQILTEMVDNGLTNTVETV
jgi:hypothetical protein